MQNPAEHTTNSQEQIQRETQTIPNPMTHQNHAQQQQAIQDTQDVHSNQIYQASVQGKQVYQVPQ